MIEIAELRLRGLAPRAVDVLERLLTAESESVALGAANSLVDRSCGKARERVEMAASITELSTALAVRPTLLRMSPGYNDSLAYSLGPTSTVYSPTSPRLVAPAQM